MHVHSTLLTDITCTHHCTYTHKYSDFLVAIFMSDLCWGLFQLTVGGFSCP
jgi:hypothetical protein